jgi:hypothetical protein
MARWLDPANKAEFEAMSRRSKALGRPRAVYNIAKDLHGLMERASSLVAEAPRAGKGACCQGGRARGGQQGAALVAA